MFPEVPSRRRGNSTKTHTAVKMGSATRDFIVITFVVSLYTTWKINAAPKGSE
jgi:hypothetical protein